MRAAMAAQGTVRPAGRTISRPGLRQRQSLIEELQRFDKLRWMWLGYIYAQSEYYRLRECRLCCNSLTSF